MATEFEITARWKKATAFAAHLYSHGILSGEIDRITDCHWDILAASIQEKPPSGPATVSVIRFLLQRFEEAVSVRVKERAEKEQ